MHEVPVVHPVDADGVFSLLWLIIALPAFGAAVLLLVGNRRSQPFGHWLGLATMKLFMFTTVVRLAIVRIRPPPELVAALPLVAEKGCARKAALLAALQQRIYMAGQ